MSEQNRTYPGDYIPHDLEIIENCTYQLFKAAEQANLALVPCVEEFKIAVESNPTLNSWANNMFEEAKEIHPTTPSFWPELPNFDQFIVYLNYIVQAYVPFFIEHEVEGKEEAMGLIGFPINALLNWPMATDSGYEFFQNETVNQHLETILKYWGNFLTEDTEIARIVLSDQENKNFPGTDITYTGWLSPTALEQMVAVACPENQAGACAEGVPPKEAFQSIFNCPDPTSSTYGFTSWDHFFTRTFKKGIRPVGDAPIVNACESAPLQIKTNVQLKAPYQLKGQPYSLINMFDGDEEWANYYEGGTIYQAFLSALSYHRWNSPVDGRVVATKNIQGTYYLENKFVKDDSSAPNDSQAFITAVAARAYIIIDTEGYANIGKVCIMPVGMAEVSSCDITVEIGQEVQRGEQIGMFHFGGSTHCVIFNRDVKLEWSEAVQKQLATPMDDRVNIPVRSDLAKFG